MRQRRSNQGMRVQEALGCARKLGDRKGIRSEQIEPRHGQYAIEVSERGGARMASGNISVSKIFN